MEVVSVCPLRVASLVWQPRRGTWAVTLVAKATYALAPVESPLAPEQEYPNEDDNYWNDDPARSLYSPSDLAPFKPRADVVLVGNAFSPRKEPVRSLIARIIVGEIDKAIEVHGERFWTQEGLLREGPRFVKMPLRYERAAGGPETSNPVGVRLDARPDSFGNVQIPNLQPTGRHIAERSDVIEPIGFGPISPAWAARRGKLGRSAATFKPGIWVEQPMPEDIDPSYFNVAPLDQQVEALRANERLILENLHPEHPRLVTNLCGVAPQAFVERRGVPPQELRMICDTLWIDTDRSICTLTWRGQLPIEHPGQPGRVLVAKVDPGQRLTWAEVERLARERLVTENTATDAVPQKKARKVDQLIVTDEVTNVGPLAAAAALPFGGTAPPAPPPMTPPRGKKGAAPKLPTSPGLVPPPAPAPARPAPVARAGDREVIELLWYDPDAFPGAAREVAALLTDVGPVDAAGIREALEDAVSEAGIFTPPRVHLLGDLSFPFDDLATLRAVVTVATPLLGDDKKLREAVHAAHEILRAPWLESACGVAEELATRIREAFALGDRKLPAAYLDTHTRRMLLEQRGYQRRKIFGGTWIRSLFHQDGATALPAYLPEALGLRVPMVQRFKGRLIAEVHLPQDEQEAQPVALRIMALGRAVPTLPRLPQAQGPA